MAFLSGLVTYLIRYAVFGLVAFLGILCGKKIRMSKDAKK